MSLSYRNQSIDLQSKSMDWFLNDRDLKKKLITLLPTPGLQVSPSLILNVSWPTIKNKCNSN